MWHGIRYTRYMARRPGKAISENSGDASDLSRPVRRDNEGCVSTQDAAPLLGVSSRTLTEWRSKGCTAIKDGGRVDTAGVRRWREARIKEEAAQDSAEMIEAIGGLSVEVIDAQKAQVELRLLELKLAEKLGLMLPRSIYEHALSTVFADATSLLRSIGSQTGPMVAIEDNAARCTAMINEKIDDALSLMTVDQALNINRTGAKEIDAD